MQNELDIVRDVSVKLDSASIGYMLTGSMAMNYYAQPRMTRDIDVVVALRPRRMPRESFSCSAPNIMFRAKWWIVPSRTNQCST